MRGTYEAANFRQLVELLFNCEPETSLWVHPDGDWIEW
jgi:hypothetical protein